MVDSTFEETVRDTLDQLPHQVQEVLDTHGIDVIIKQHPDPSVSRELSGELFGLFTGVPLPEQSPAHSSTSPTRIELYEEPFFRYIDNKADRQDQIRKTVLHEVGHFLGMSEQDLHERGF